MIGNEMVLRVYLYIPGIPIWSSRAFTSQVLVLTVQSLSIRRSSMGQFTWPASSTESWLLIILNLQRWNYTANIACNIVEIISLVNQLGKFLGFTSQYLSLDSSFDIFSHAIGPTFWFNLLILVLFLKLHELGFLYFKVLRSHLNVFIEPVFFVVFFFVNKHVHPFWLLRIKSKYVFIRLFPYISHANQIEHYVFYRTTSLLLYHLHERHTCRRRFSGSATIRAKWLLCLTVFISQVLSHSRFSRVFILF